VTARRARRNESPWVWGVPGFTGRHARRSHTRPGVGHLRELEFADLALHRFPQPVGVRGYVPYIRRRLERFFGSEHKLTWPTNIQKRQSSASPRQATTAGSTSTDRPSMCSWNGAKAVDRRRSTRLTRRW
jgi:hypothetical protein